MRSYFFRTPKWLQWMYPHYVWQVKTQAKVIFLTFDDGPDPHATNYVLEQLRQYSARATFFCVGKQIELYPELYQKLQVSGHAIGNHTYNHTNGWKTDWETYLEDVRGFEVVADRFHSQTSLFRPPYGRMTRSQARELSKRYHIIMWSHLSGDFDNNLHVEQAKRALLTGSSGSIFLFHDSFAAHKNLKKLLPVVLDYYSRQGYIFKSLSDYEIS